jgi:hypothetical protein
VGGVPAQVAVLECLLPVVQQFAHVPEAVLAGSGFSRSRGGDGVRMDAGQREMPER